MSTSLIPIDFHSDRIFLLEQDGEPFVPMKPICDALGLDWKSQHRKLTSGDRDWRCGHMTIPSAGGPQEMLCLPLMLLPAWLFSVSPARVKPELKDKLIAYQAECADVLWRHFMGEKQAVQSELEHIRKAAERLRAHVLADRPYWNKIARYWDLGLSVVEIAQLLRRPLAEVEAHHVEMRRCGAIASKIDLGGPWADCTGPLAGHAQDQRPSAAIYHRPAQGQLPLDGEAGHAQT